MDIQFIWCSQTSVTMKSQKKVILKAIPRTLFVFLLVIIFFLPQAEAANVLVSPSNKIVEQGQNFNLDISIEPLGTPISGVQLDIIYDISLLNLNNINEGNLFTQDGATTYFSKGTIDYSEGIAKNMFQVILGPYSISKSGTFLRLSFTPIGQSGISDIKISNVLISDLDGTIVPSIVTNGQININSDIVIPDIIGDLNGNGISADAGDIVLMKRAVNGEIEADSRYDLNKNGRNADAGDLVLIRRASIGDLSWLT